MKKFQDLISALPEERQQKSQEGTQALNQIGVVIGRFQVDEIHEGHVKLLRYVERQHPSILILLGCKSAPQDGQNPLEFAPRAQMMHAVCPTAVILPVWDCESDEEWSANVDLLIQRVFPTRSAMLYGGRNSFIEHYKGKFSTANLDFYQTNSGTSIRERISSFPENTSSFRAGIIYGLTNLQPRLFTTVDIAVLTRAVFGCIPQILLGRRSFNYKWRLPGGFIDLKDESAEVAAKRELFEETSLEARNIRYITSMKIDDWRSRGAKDVGHMTILFTVSIFDGEAEGSDDLPDVRWFSLTEATLIEVTPEHQPLFKEILNL